MFYLCLTFSFLWVCLFAYLFILDRKIKDLAKRLSARTASDQQQ